eukprot:267374_1
MAKNPTIIKRLMTQECKILNKLIYFHENKYHIGSLSYLSLKWCHIKDSKSKRDMRIIWNNIFIIDSVNNTEKIKAIMEPGSSIEGYLAMNSTHRDYQRVFSVDKASKSNDINRVKFRDDKEWIELDEFINNKTDTFPTLVPMMRAINTKIYKKFIRQIKHNQMVKMVVNKNDNNDNQKLNRNVFLRDTDIPIHYYHETIKELNNQFRIKLANVTIQSYRRRFDNLKDLQHMRLFNPRTLLEWLATHPLPKKRMAKNRIIDWYIEHNFGMEDLNKSHVKLSEYYQMGDADIDGEFREYVYLLHKHKDWKMREFWKMKYKDIQRLCPATSAYGLHSLIAPWDAAMCDRGFSQQNLHITKNRTSIGTPLLRNLLMICLNGPEWKEHEKLYSILTKALIIWGQTSNYKY